MQNKYNFTGLCYRAYQQNSSYEMIGAGFTEKPNVKIDCENKTYSHFAVVYVLRGQGTYTDHNGKTYTIRPGSLFLRNPAHPHSLVIDPNSDFLEAFVAWKYVKVESSIPKITESDFWSTDYVEADSSAREILNQLNIIDTEVPVLFPGINDEVIERFYQIYHQMKRCPLQVLPTWRLEIMNLLSTLNNLHHSPSNMMLENRKLVGEIQAIIEENIGSRTPLPELLENIGKSYSALRKIFKNEMGMSMGNYQIQCRIEEAFSMLTHNHPIKEISNELGYNDQFAFSTQFKKVTGFSPSQYKRHFYTEK